MKQVSFFLSCLRNTVFAYWLCTGFLLFNTTQVLFLAPHGDNPYDFVGERFGIIPSSPSILTAPSGLTPSDRSSDGSPDASPGALSPLLASKLPPEIYLSDNQNDFPSYEQLVTEKIIEETSGFKNPRITSKTILSLNLISATLFSTFLNHLVKQLTSKERKNPIHICLFYFRDGAIAQQEELISKKYFEELAELLNDYRRWNGKMIAYKPTRGYSEPACQWIYDHCGVIPADGIKTTHVVVIFPLIRDTKGSCKVVFVETRNGKGPLLPGGYVRFNNDANKQLVDRENTDPYEEDAWRELQEETGLSDKVAGVISYNLIPFDPVSQDDVTIWPYLIKLTIKDEDVINSVKPTDEDEEVRKVIVVSLKELEEFLHNYNKDEKNLFLVTKFLTYLKNHRELLG